MSGIRAIARIRRRDLGDFWRTYVCREQPVIITDLYENDPISRINTISEARKTLGDLPIHIGRNYFDGFAGANTGDRATTISRYFDVIEKHATAELLCREQGMPDKMKGLFAIPDIARFSSRSGATSLMYVANHGTVAPLHFDGDQREVLFTQMLGQKRIFLIKPAFGARFCSFKSLSGIPVHRFDEAERQNFFSYNEAFGCTLNSGETLYIPKLWWHYLENIGVTMAFNVRFGLGPASRKLRLLPFNYLSQNISRELVDPATGEARDESVVTHLLETYLGAHQSSQKRLVAIEKELSNVYREVCKSSVQVPYLAEWYSSAKALGTAARREWFGYKEPLLLGRGDLHGKCKSSHLAKLKATAESKGYSRRFVEMLREAFGFSRDIGALTLLEATILANGLLVSDSVEFKDRKLREAPPVPIPA